MKIKWIGIVDTLHVILFSGNFEKCCSIRHWKLPEIQTGILGQMESSFISGNKVGNGRRGKTPPRLRSHD